MIYLPFIGAMALASATILEKFVLRKRNINPKLFQSAAFLASVIVMLPLLYFFWSVSPEALQAKNLLIFLLVIIASLFANMALFFALKWEKVSNLEPALIMEPLFTVLLAFLFSFFTIGLYESDPKILIPAIIAGAALIFSHIKKHHIEMNKYFLAAILGSFLFGSELILSRLILDYYNPITFYFLRCASVFLLSWIIFKPQFSKLKTRVRWEMLIIGALWVAFRVIVYYGYLAIGVVFTTLLVMLGPVFVYLFARIFLKEKLEWRNMLSAIIIIGCVLYVVLG